MLMNEIASAEDTLELWKMVNDSVWAALQKLQTEEKMRKAAEQRAAAKRGSRKPKRAANAFSPVEVPPFPTPANANANANANAATAASKQPTTAVGNAANAKAKSDAAYAVADMDGELANSLPTSSTANALRTKSVASNSAKRVG